MNVAILASLCGRFSLWPFLFVSVLDVHCYIVLAKYVNILSKTKCLINSHTQVMQVIGKPLSTAHIFSLQQEKRCELRSIPDIRANSLNQPLMTLCMYQ